MVPEVLRLDLQIGIAPDTLGRRETEAEAAVIAPVARRLETEAEVAPPPAWPGLAEGRRRAGGRDGGGRATGAAAPGYSKPAREESGTSHHQVRVASTGSQGRRA